MAFDALVAPLRQGLLLHCYRMLASSHDAEDAVQETLIRAWRSLDRFEGRSALRTWVFTVATNVCLREIERRGRRVLPVDLSPASAPGTTLAAPLTETVWLGRCPAPAWSGSPRRSTPSTSRRRRSSSRSWPRSSTCRRSSGRCS